MASSHVVASHITKILSSFRQILQFRFRENRQGRSPVKSDQNKAISVHVLWVSFHHRSTPVLSSSHQKINFLHYISVTAVKCAIVPVQGTIFRRQKNPRRVYRPKMAGILFVSNEPEGKYYTVPYNHSHLAGSLLAPSGD